MIRGRTNRRRSPHHWSETLRRILSPRTYLLRHTQVAFDSLGRLYRNPVASLMTAAVIGIALAMPAGLFILLENLDRLSGSWDGQASLSVFLQDKVTAEDAVKLADQVRRWPEVAEVTLITPAQALEEFSQRSGFGDVLGTLEKNPLPVVLLVSPGLNYTDPHSAGALRDKFRTLPETALAQLDLQWVQRLAAMLETAQRGVLVIRPMALSGGRFSTAGSGTGYWAQSLPGYWWKPATGYWPHRSGTWQVCTKAALPCKPCRFKRCYCYSSAG
jgi:hypothetical protein